MKCIIIDTLSALILDTNTYGTVVKLDCQTQIEYQLLNQEHEVDIISYNHNTNVYTVKIKD